jgi:RNA polymerase sigma-70 factor, ECF subfamily
MSNPAPKPDMSRIHVTQQEPDTALVESAMAGDQDAVATLTVWLRTAMLRYCRSRLGDTESRCSSAEDLAQEICIDALGVLSRDGEDPASFVPLVYGIAAHKVVDHDGCQDRFLSIPVADLTDGADSEASPEQLIMAGELRARLDLLLDRLTRRQREILVLRFSAGLTARETGMATGLTHNAVRVMQHRARVNLRNVMSPAEWLK